MTGRRRRCARPHASGRALVALAAAITAALLATACTPAPKKDGIAKAGTEASGTVELWHFFTEREAAALDSAINDFRASHPKVKVVVKSGQDDAKMTQSIGAGKGPDVGLSYSTDIVGTFCSSGAWIDLNPYLTRDSVDLAQFNPVTRQYTEFKGKRCAMPVLADAYGIFYNKQLFAEAGIAGPPKTLDELAEDAKKLTKRGPDGTIQVAGFLPLFSFYENSPAHLAGSPGTAWRSWARSCS
jgi:multiple sugar transport system substrate-binding protein